MLCSKGTVVATRSSDAGAVAVRLGHGSIYKGKSGCEEEAVHSGEIEQTDAGEFGQIHGEAEASRLTRGSKDALPAVLVQEVGSGCCHGDETEDEKSCAVEDRCELELAGRVEGPDKPAQGQDRRRLRDLDDNLEDILLFEKGEPARGGSNVALNGKGGDEQQRNR